MTRFLDWVNERTSYRTLLKEAFDEPVVGGARWAYVFGSALLFLVIVQFATGMLLAMYYSPSSREAWGSVHYISHELTLGWFVRGVHHWAASAMVVLLLLHMLQVFIFGAYRAPREFAWWSGLVLMLVTFAFALTGYLLPWDQRGYWATRVTANVAGSLPVVGRSLKALIQGGGDFGTLTLTRFFATHAVLLPALLVGTLVVHVALFRRRGATPHWARPETELRAHTEPFWPRQVAYDVLFSALVIAVVVALTLRHHGAPLEAPADPSSNFPARPEWYFLWMFELLKFLPGAWEGVGVSLFVLFVAGLLIALPILDHGSSRLPKNRVLVLTCGAAALIGVLSLTFRARGEDARDMSLQRQQQVAEAAAVRSFALARLGIPPGGADELYLNDPLERGSRLFAAQCKSCHKAEGSGGDSAPDLTGYMSHPWVQSLLLNPSKPEFYGRALAVTMPAADVTEEELKILVHYVLSLGGQASAPDSAAKLFEENGCSDCHARRGEAPRRGPSLDGFGSRPWLRSIILTPGAATRFGEANRMPAFEGRLTDSEVDDLLTYLLSMTAAEKTGRLTP